MNDNKHFSNQLIDEINVDPGKNYFTEILIKTISKIGTKKKILDVGCGNGAFTQILKKNFKSYLVGVDGNEHGLKISKSRGFDETYLINDFSNNKLSMLKDLDYDLVVSKDVLEHVLNPEYAFRQFWNKIKKGGYLLIHVPNHFPLYGRIKFLKSNNIDTFNYFPNHKRYNYPHIRFYNYESILSLISNYNHEIVENFSYNFFVFPFLNKVFSNKIKKKIVNNFPNSFCEAYTLLIKKL